MMMVLLFVSGMNQSMKQSIGSPIRIGVCGRFGVLLQYGMVRDGRCANKSAAVVVLAKTASARLV
jgi:hypothetical protein